MPEPENHPPSRWFLIALIAMGLLAAVGWASIGAVAAYLINFYLGN